MPGFCFVPEVQQSLVCIPTLQAITGFIPQERLSGQQAHEAQNAVDNFKNRLNVEQGKSLSQISLSKVLQYYAGN